MAPSDEELLLRVCTGDRAAFGALYDRYAPQVLGFLERLLRKRSDAEDVLQTTFLQVWRSAARFDAARGSGAGWLFMLARSRAIDCLRRHRARPDATAAREADVAAASEPNAERQESRGVIHSALAALPASQGQAVRLAFLDGFTHAEIAEQLGVPLGTAKTWIRRGMQGLRNALQAHQEVAS